MNGLNTKQKEDIMYHWRFPDGFRFSSPEEENRWRVVHSLVADRDSNNTLTYVEASQLVYSWEIPKGFEFANPEEEERVHRVYTEYVALSKRIVAQEKSTQDRLAAKATRADWEFKKKFQRQISSVHSTQDPQSRCSD